MPEVRVAECPGPLTHIVFVQEEHGRAECLHGVAYIDAPDHECAIGATFGVRRPDIRHQVIEILGRRGTRDDAGHGHMCTVARTCGMGAHS